MGYYDDYYNSNKQADFSSCDPLDFWKQYAPRFPILAQMARDIFAIPASSVGVERLFNRARDLCTYQKHKLLLQTIRDLMIMTCVSSDEMEKEFKEVEALLDLEDIELRQEFYPSKQEEEDFKNEDYTGLISDSDERPDPKVNETTRSGRSADLALNQVNLTEPLSPLNKRSKSATLLVT